MHANVGMIKSRIANVRAAIRHVRAAAEQLTHLDRWREMLRDTCARIVTQTNLATPPPAPAAPG
jgi:hypothetical protein